MIPDYLSEQIGRYGSEFFIYPWELFKQRLQEEMIRSDRSGSPFTYVEFPFASLGDCWQSPAEAKAFWTTLFSVLANAARGSDVKGFLENDEGLGLVMLDSPASGWSDFYQRISQVIAKRSPEMVEKLDLWENGVKKFFYPDCVRSREEQTISI